MDNTKIKKGVNPDDKARNLELPEEASTQISRSTKAQPLALSGDSDALEDGADPQCGGSMNGCGFCCIRNAI